MLVLRARAKVICRRKLTIHNDCKQASENKDKWLISLLEKEIVGLFVPFVAFHRYSEHFRRGFDKIHLIPPPILLYIPWFVLASSTYNITVSHTLCVLC